MINVEARRKWSLTLLTILLSFALTSPSAAADWISIETDHFFVVSSASQRTSLRFSRDLEAFRAFFGNLFGAGGLSAPIPTKVYLFRSQDHLYSFMGLSRSASLRNVGFFSSSPHANYFVVDVSSDAGNDVLFHELVHDLVRQTMPHAPRWLNEGLAEFFSTYQRDKVEAMVGRIVPRHLQWLLDNPNINVENLVAVGRSSPRGHGGPGIGDFYAQSWAWVHLLLTGDSRLRAQLVDYLEELRAGSSGPEAFERAFDTTPQKMNAKIWGHVKQGRHAFFRIPTTVEELTLETRPVTKADSEVHLADLLSSMGPRRFAEARKGYLRALDLNPDHALAQAGLGYILSTSAQRGQSLEQLRGSIEQSPKHYLPWYLLGHELLGSLPKHSTASLSDEHRERLEEARSHLAKAIEYRPQFAPAFADLGSSYLYELDKSLAGVAALTRAHSLMPHRFDYTRNLAGADRRRGCDWTRLRPCRQGPGPFTEELQKRSSETGG